MSKQIESLARGLKDTISGAVKPPAGEFETQTERGHKLIKNLATGGAALGAGTGAVVALVNYLRSLRQEDELEDESRMNDDTLYVKVPGSAEKSAGVNPWLAPGIGVTGGILTASGAYALTQMLYNKLQKRRREEMLDEAQGEAFEAAETEVRKSAAENEGRFSFHDLVTAFPVAVPLLAALASGGVSYAALNKTFPVIRRPKSKYPKRIRQVTDDGEVKDLPEEDEVLKSAADYAAERDIEDAGYEFLAVIVDRMAQEKKASICLTSDILNRAAKDGIEGLVQLQKEGGLEAVAEGVKGASHTPADLPSKVLAATTICKSARLRPVLTALAAAEFQELAPSMMETVVSYGAEHMEKLAGIAPLMHYAFLRPLILEKSAMANPLIETLSSLAEPDMEAMESALTSDASGGMAEESEGDDGFEAGYDPEIPENEDDPVDAFLEGEKERSSILGPEYDDEDEGIVAGDL